MDQYSELKKIIRSESRKLLCETHPEVCRLRDINYPHFENLVLDLIFKEAEPVSVQSAIAELEQELSDTSS